jgi:microcin C transport system substrate-binding protein
VVAVSFKGGRMVDEAGEQFRIEFLGSSPTSEVIAGGLIASLRKIGIDATLRIVDPSQYVNRINGFDFDAVTGVFAQTLSPGNEQRDYWGSEAAEIEGSRNLGGIKSPVVDALINEIIFAEDRDHLVAATRALDRVLLWAYYMIPQYHRPVVWIAYWDKFGIPPTQPEYVGVDIDSWWIETDKEEEVEQQYEDQE